MTKKELADLIGVDPKTLSNWEKTKPELVRLINQGLAIDESIEATSEHLKRLEQIKEQASQGKFKLK